MTLRWPSIAFTITLAIVACAGGGDFEVPLPNGYFIARVSTRKFCVVAPDEHTVILPDISLYRVDNDIVGGQTPGSAGGAFFLLDTKTHSLVTDLSQIEWLKRRSALGLRDNTLRQPRPVGSMWPRRRK